MTSPPHMLRKWLVRGGKTTIKTKYWSKWSETSQKSHDKYNTQVDTFIFIISYIFTNFDKTIYYIDIDEIQGFLQCRKNGIFNMRKISYLNMWRYHCCHSNKQFLLRSRFFVLCLIDIYIINRILHGRLVILILSSHVQFRYQIEHSRIKLVSPRSNEISSI